MHYGSIYLALSALTSANSEKLHGMQMANCLQEISDFSDLRSGDWRVLY